MTVGDKPLALRLTPQAIRDLEEIWLFTAATWSVDQADSYITELNDTFELICFTPQIARERQEISPPVRMHRHRSHLIIYRLVDRVVVIVRVLHMKAHWQSALDDLGT